MGNEYQRLGRALSLDLREELDQRGGRNTPTLVGQYAVDVQPPVTARWSKVSDSGMIRCVSMPPSTGTIAWCRRRKRPVLSIS